MTSLNLAKAILLAATEAAGAYWFFKTKSSNLRRLMTSFGFGFAIAIVLFDILPDATEHFPVGYFFFALGLLLFFAVWIARHRSAPSGKALGTGTVAVSGMALHNLGEGILLSAMTGPISPLLVVGALLHKLPEGMATYALLDGTKEKRRFAFAALVGLMIPLGAWLRISPTLQQPVMALLSGMILFAVSTAIVERFPKAVASAERWSYAVPCLAGAVIGGLSCLIA